MSPVKFEPPGKIGTNPNMLLIKMKKKSVYIYGVYFKYFSSPIFSFAISSRTKSTKGSTNLANPFGGCKPSALYVLTAALNNTDNNTDENNKVNTCFVIEKSRGFGFITCPSASKSNKPASFNLYIFS